MESLVLHSGAAWIRQPQRSQSLHQPADQRPDARPPVRGDLPGQLRHRTLGPGPAANVGVLQHAVLRYRVRVPAVQLHWTAAVCRAGRQALLPVVHARRARQLLAVQWRVERRSALSTMSGSTIVTGAAGFAGSHLLDLLAADGVDVVAWHRPGGHPPREVPGVRWRAVDLLDQRAVLRAVDDAAPGVVYHCAGAAHVGQSWGKAAATLRANVLGTHSVVEALRTAAPDARLLVTSSALVYGPSVHAIDETQPIRPANPYGLSKVAQEMVAWGEGGHPHTFIARPFNHFGPRQEPTFVSAAFARQIARIEAGLCAPEIHVGNLEALRDLTDVRDTVC